MGATYTIVELLNDGCHVPLSLIFVRIMIGGTHLEIHEAGTRQRPVGTDNGTVHAIDCLVRAHRPIAD
jgi:hypothetical protein